MFSASSYAIRQTCFGDSGFVVFVFVVFVMGGVAERVAMSLVSSLFFAKIKRVY